MRSRVFDFVVFMLIMSMAVSGCSSRVGGWFQTGRIEGRVMDQDGNLVENAQVMMRDRTGKITYNSPDYYEGGIFTFSNVRYGRYLMEITADGYADLYRIVNLKFGSNIEVDVVLFKPFTSIQSAIDSSLSGLGRIMGEVIDLSNGQGLSRGTVRLGKTNIGAITGNDGSYVIDNIPHGEYNLIGTYLGYDKMEIEKILIRPNVVWKISFGMSPLKEYMWLNQDQYPSFWLDKYQTSNKATLNSEEIETMPVSTLEDILKRMPGIK
jgi:hypothetical protein